MERGSLPVIVPSTNFVNVAWMPEYAITRVATNLNNLGVGQH
jgi:hypothetical protein